MTKIPFERASGVAAITCTGVATVLGDQRKPKGTGAKANTSKRLQTPASDKSKTRRPMLELGLGRG
jgi:hypothetical protein